MKFGDQEYFQDGVLLDRWSPTINENIVEIEIFPKRAELLCIHCTWLVGPSLK
jgi:hypothetical protein